MASLLSDGRTGPFNKSTFFCIIISPEKTLENESEDIITYEIEERQEDSDKNHRKIPEKWLTRVAPYNIIRQYDKRRNSTKPKPRSLADFDIIIMKMLMIHRR